jgi:DNA-binding NarL/FixJ family response regulator
VRVVVADDNLLIREGLAALLREAGIDVVGKAASGDDLLLKVRSYRPDVAIVDVRMPPTHTDEGLRAARQIRSEHREIGVLILSQHLEVPLAMRLLSEGAEGLGYLLKERVTDLEEFKSALRRVADGGSALDPLVVSQLLSRGRNGDPLGALTPREREVLELLAEGRSNKAIAEQLVITLRAVQKHVTSIFAKLNLPATDDDHRRILAVLTYLRA